MPVSSRMCQRIDAIVTLSDLLPGNQAYYGRIVRLKSGNMVAGSEADGFSSSVLLPIEAIIVRTAPNWAARV